MAAMISLLRLVLFLAFHNKHFSWKWLKWSRLTDMLETGWNCLYMVPPPHCFRLFPFNQKASVQDENWRMVYTLQWTSLPNNRRWKRKILPTSNLEQPTFVLSQSTSLRSCRGQHPSKKVVWGWDRCCASDGWPSDQVVNPKQRFCWLIMFKRFQKYGLFVEMELDRHNLLHALEAKGDWESHVGSHSVQVEV